MRLITTLDGRSVCGGNSELEQDFAVLFIFAIGGLLGILLRRIV